MIEAALTKTDGKSDDPDAFVKAIRSVNKAIKTYHKVSQFWTIGPEEVPSEPDVHARLPADEGLTRSCCTLNRAKLEKYIMQSFSSESPAGLSDDRKRIGVGCPCAMRGGAQDHD